MTLNDPRLYHRMELETLGWELTVCNALSLPESPCFKLLKRKKTYGSLLYDFLKYLGLDFEKILEVGGGYGFLLRDFLEINPHLQATLWDISPSLIKKQQENLRDKPVAIEERDVLAAHPASFRAFDLVIMNEMMGDLPTLTNVRLDETPNSSIGEKPSFLTEAKRMMASYALSVPTGPFNFNIGALWVLEKILTAGVKIVFVSEHSCEATVPEDTKSLVSVSAPGYPEAIPLRGHTEYTIKFSHLEKVARAYRYLVKRGPLADFIPLEMSERLKVCLRAPAPRTPDEEIFRQFVSDLYQYEYLLLTKGDVS